MSKQTAVEWLQDQFRAFGTITDSNDENTHQLIKSAIDMCERAKTIEREQIIEFGRKVADHWGMTEVPKEYIEQYFIQTYKGGEQ